MSLTMIEHARSALLANAEATAHYLFTVDGITVDNKIVEHVKAELKHKAAEHIDDSKYLDLIRKGSGRYTAARKLNIDPVAIMRRLRIDQDFADKVRVSEAEALEPAVEKAHELAKDGEKWALIFLLERKNSDEFAAPDKKVSVNHNHKHRHELILGQTSDPIDREILELTQDLTEQHETRALNAGVIDIPEEDIEEM